MSVPDKSIIAVTIAGLHSGKGRSGGLDITLVGTSGFNWCRGISTACVLYVESVSPTVWFGLGCVEAGGRPLVGCVWSGGELHLEVSVARSGIHGPPMLAEVQTSAQGN